MKQSEDVVCHDIVDEKPEDSPVLGGYTRSDELQKRLVGSDTRTLSVTNSPCLLHTTNSAPCFSETSFQRSLPDLSATTILLPTTETLVDLPISNSHISFIIA